jgi:hypothetical protein
MADIAMVFHWGPDVMEAMEIEDLSAWHEKARDRFEAQNKQS